MKIEKMSFANAQKLSRKEMRSVMAGSSGGVCLTDSRCSTGCGSYAPQGWINCNSCCYA